MRWLLLLLFAAFNALADLPTMEDPSRGQGQGIYGDAAKLRF